RPRRADRLGTPVGGHRACPSAKRDVGLFPQLRRAARQSLDREGLIVMDERAIRHRAIDLNGECWRLLEKPDRTPAETAAMVAAAKESLDLWKQVGTAVNAQRGAWLVARAAVDARDVDGALDF